MQWTYYFLEVILLVMIHRHLNIMLQAGFVTGISAQNLYFTFYIRFVPGNKKKVLRVGTMRRQIVEKLLE